MEGFLGTRAPLMVDVVACALFVLLPGMALGIWLARYGGRYSLHKWLQLGLAVVLLLAVAAFEADIRLHGWEERASSSPYYPRGVKASLWIHLPFAISTLVLWAVVIARALRLLPSTSAEYGRTATPTAVHTTVFTAIGASVAVSRGGFAAADQTYRYASAPSSIAAMAKPSA